MTVATFARLGRVYLPPKRIIFIRHAEKPDSGNGDRGVAPDGSVDDESLTIRGWQRAGALTLFFFTRSEIKPSVIFASGIGHDSKSKRPIETVTALAGQIHPAPLITTHLRDDLHPPDGGGIDTERHGARVLGAQAYSCPGRPSAGSAGHSQGLAG